MRLLEQERMRMPSKSATKTELPLLVTEGSKTENIIVTIDAISPKETLADKKEEAGKPLYLKRI